MDLKELYSSITAQVVAQIESGAGKWRMPWQSIADAGSPVNASTGAPYRGGNHMIFGMVAAGHGWSGNWGTYKQWQSIGAQVRKGEKATQGIKWSVTEDSKTGERRMVPFCFSVFSAEQVDGWTAPNAIVRDTPERIAAADTFLSALGSDVRHGGNRACYSPSGDFILMPNLDQFDVAADYYSTSFHEHAHWTGHGSRLARDASTKFGSDSYAAEELVAELSAAFTCARLGISQAPRPDHAAYLAGWLRVLKSDTSALFHAASKAQAASDYLGELAEVAMVPA